MSGLSRHVAKYVSLWPSVFFMFFSCFFHARSPTDLNLQHPRSVPRRSKPLEAVSPTPYLRLCLNHLPDAEIPILNPSPTFDGLLFEG